MSEWRSTQIPFVSVDGGNTVHVMPVDDLVQHFAEPKCVCGPSPERGGSGWLFTHHSLDGREHDE